MVCDKIGVPQKTTNENSKPGWEIQLETLIRNLLQQAKMIRQRKNTVTCGDKKEKATKVKITIQLEETNQKATGERRKIKKVSRQDKTIQTKQDIPKQ